MLSANGWVAGASGTSSNTVGNVTATVTDNTSFLASAVTMNFTIIDTFNETSWYKITFPGGFNAGSVVVDVNINGSSNPVTWTNVTGALTVNVSSNDPANVSADSTVVQYINLSNITVPATPNSYTINVQTNNSVTIPLTYNVIAEAPSITGSSPTSPVTDGEGAARTFSINLNQTMNITWFLNGIQVGYNESVTSATYTNDSAFPGTWTINATANNTNGTVSKEWIWIVSETSEGGSSGETINEGVSTFEPFDNIAKAERHDGNLIADSSVTYAFTSPELGIYQVAITGKDSEDNIAVRVEVLKDTSKLAATSAPGAVYKNLNVWAGTKNIREVTIRFKVEDSWIERNNFVRNDIRLVTWQGSKWAPLTTAEKSKETSYTFYEVKSDTLSVFAIIGLKGKEIQTAIENSAPPAKTTTTKATGLLPEAQAEKAAGFEVILSIVSLFSISYIRKKKG